jgi:hypothetical protein
MPFTLYIRVLLVLAVFGVASATHATPGEVPDKVLFVGNSFTFYNNGIHTHYRNLVRSAQPDEAAQGRVRILTMSGARLPEHRAALGSVLGAEDWDVVVLQGHSRGPIEEVTAGPFRDAARQYVSEIREHGAEPVFFMTWAYADAPEMTEKLESAYDAIAAELDARVIPVGLAFAQAKRERPDIKLYADDEQHPSLAGTYLAACMFYVALQGASPEGINYDAGLDSDVSRYLQRLAWQW